MPALTIFRNFTTRPFAGDDLQLICFVLGTYRFIQLLCLIPIVIISLIDRFKGQDLLYNGYGRWCPQYELTSENEFISLTYDDRLKVSRPKHQYIFTALACIYMLIDIAWMFALWSASSVGTPTQPKGRDRYLRPLIIFKLGIINLFPILLVIWGIYKTYMTRMNNFGCGMGVELVYDPDATPRFGLFAVLLVTYALELLVFPAIVMNKIVHCTRSHLVQDRYSAQKRSERFEFCLGSCMKCLSVCLRNPNLGGQELKNTGELKDFASNLMEFANNDTKLDLVLSDMYVGGKLLARVQAERRLIAIQRLQQTSNDIKTEREKKKKNSEKNTMNKMNSIFMRGVGVVELERTAERTRDAVQELTMMGVNTVRGALMTQQHDNNRLREKEQKEVEVEEEGEDDMEGSKKDDNGTGASGLRGTLKRVEKRRSVLTLQSNEEGKEYVIIEKDVLSSDNKDDMDVLNEAAHYCMYAEYVYWHFQLVAVEQFALSQDETRFIASGDDAGAWSWDHIREKCSLSSIGLDESQLIYAHFYSGLAATPYAVILDEVKNTVVITIRGTISMEDWVIDLQYVPQPLDSIGDICGFNGKNHHCHKGVLSRAKWLYNDLKKYRILKKLFAPDSPYKDHNLVVVGHSLGGGCAQVLSLMLRPSFPKLKCFAYEPPGCIFDDKLCGKAKEWITSIVRGDDVVPRLTQPNLECLRDEFFDVVAQIKVPKIVAFRDVRTPCPQSHLVTRNASMLCPKARIDRDTSFSKKLREFRDERATKNKESCKLYIAGKIIHLVDTTGDETKYVPYWASRYEFNQVELSKSMLSDHSIPPLVTILKNLNLDEKHEVIAYQNVMEEDEEEDEAEARVFVCFSNPHGKVALLVFACAFAAWFCNLWSIQGCKFVFRSTTIIFTNGTTAQGYDMSAGMWSYNLRECINPDDCDEFEPNDFEESSFCQPYPLYLHTVDPNWAAARAASTLANVIGFLGIGVVMFSTSMKLKKRSCIALFIMMILSCLFGGIQFLFLHGMICNEWYNPKDENYVTAQCSLNRNGQAAIAAVVLWFVASLGSGAMIYAY